MKITIVCDVLGEENNGTTIAAMNLIRSLRAKGHTVTVVCPDESRRGQPGYFVMPTYNFGIFNNYVKKNGVTLGKNDPALMEKALEGAEVVHIMTPFSLGHAAAKLACAKGIPITAGFHCQAENITNHIFLMNADLANRTVYRVIYKRLYRYCTAIHYPTQFICDVFESQVGPTNHYVISNGVNRDFHPVAEEKPAEYRDKFVVLSTGRYSREKSQHIIIDAVARSRYKDKIQLILAGAGPRRESLEDRARKAGIPMPIFGFYSHPRNGPGTELRGSVCPRGGN